ncbi:MarR family transcriptional regulator [Sagittula sp. NFXS13]|uniref:MarR family transcriptional regulator n=1 Tax=Sagittula sp. NFXS13 TaxID=2819095 RepID=UPI0032DF6E00
MSYVVLTGDVIASTALEIPDLDATLAEVGSVVDNLADWGVTARFARRGGDGWQIAMDTPRYDLRVALWIAARLRRLDKARATRIAIARDTGPLTDTADLNAAHGAGYTASGRLLDALDGGARMAHASGGAMHSTVVLADHIALGWTQAQARAVTLMLPPDAGPRASAADRLGISRQAVDQALHAAGYPALDAALTAWEAAE